MKKKYFLFIFLFPLLLSAQVEDNFSDGNFSENPVWTGDSANFIVNNSNQLQLNAPGSGASYLSVPAVFNNNMEWEFWVKMSFSPSDNNLSKIYLTSDSPDLNGFLDGYFIRLGENGSNDDIGLWKQTGSTVTKIISGIGGHCAKSSNTLRIKVTRNNAGDWIIFSDTLGGNNFSVEGFGNENSLDFSSFSYFGVSCKYTSSNTSKFYFDDFYIGDIHADSTDNSNVTTDSINPNDVVINEILSDPFPGEVDFIELYNRSNKPIDLQNLRVGNYDSISNMIKSPKVITSNTMILNPQNYIALSVNNGILENRYYCPHPENLLQIASMPSMNISSGTVVVASTSGTIIDKFSYNAAMQFPLLNSTKGISLERIDYNRPTQDASNWHSAAESVLATPGYKNSEYSNAENSNEQIKISPEIFSPDNDGYNDILKINYNFGKSGYVGTFIIYDSRGRLVKYLAQNELLGTKGVISWDGINENNEKARTGIYIVFVSVFNTNGKVERFKKTCVLAAKLN